MNTESTEKATDTHMPRRKRLSARNRGLLKFLEELKSTPDEMGQEWWNEYMKQLEGNRFSIRREQ